LDNSADDLTRASEAYEKAFSASPKTGSADLDAKLIKSERLLLNSDGLPNRPWFQNLVYAPGFYTGYGVKTIPGVREAIEQKRWPEAEAQITKVAKALQSEADLLDEAAKELGSR
jgi:N-acetylated-alpha-linked acidic dipeptidase